jgi:hypothetical protein
VISAAADFMPASTIAKEALSAIVIRKAVFKNASFTGSAAGD